MRAASIKQISDWCGGALIQGVPSREVSRFSTDTRTLEKGDVFLALKGDNFDGHKFLEQADSRGMACSIVQELPESSEKLSGALIHVRDTLKALQDIAAGYRRSREDLYVVGVTGSNGKTSTKDFLKSVASQANPTNATQGNLNNHIGLPLTALATESEDKIGVWEMGMNHPGEIEVLAEIAAPNAAVITNIGTAHIEHMRSQEAIADEKACLGEAVPADGFCVMPAADSYFSHIEKKIRCRLISVGFGKGDIQAESVRVSNDGGMAFDLKLSGEEARSVTLPVRGEHMVMNALLAAGVGRELGLSVEQIAEGLQTAELTSGRLQERTVRDVSFLDDSYNANPDSMAAAIQVLSSAEVSGKRIAVLGFMGELGDFEEAEHRRLGELIGGSKVDILVTVGSVAKQIQEAAGNEIQGGNFSNHTSAADYLMEVISHEDLVLVKGSRAAGMEKVIRILDEGADL